MRQFARGAHQRDGSFLHGFEKCRLGLGRRAIDFVGQQNIGEDRAGLEDDFTLALLVLLQNMRSENIARHQVGGELHPLEVELQQLTKGFDQGGFADARLPFEQQMTACENPDQDESVQVATPQQNAVEFGQNLSGHLHHGLQFFRLKQGLHHHLPGSNVFVCEYSTSASKRSAIFHEQSKAGNAGCDSQKLFPSQRNPSAF